MKIGGESMDIEFTMSTKYKIDRVFLDDIEIRPEVLEAAKEMELRLRDHDEDWGKRGWLFVNNDRNYNWFASKILNNIIELSKLIHNDGEETTIIKKAADIQNLAMMIQDNLKR